jgi:DNA polymerase III subunit beta
MKISVLQENLQKALASVVRVVDNRPTLPVLANVLLTTEDSRLRISATNLEVSVTTWIGAKIHEPGSITLPAKTLSELVSNLSNERVDMTLDTVSQSVNLRCGTTVSNLKGIDAEEYPMVPFSSEPDFAVPAKVLKEMIKHTEFAAAKDESRPILTGVFTAIDGDVLTMAAADGYRLAVRTARLETPLDAPLSMVIPARTLNEVARAIDDDTANVMIQLPGERDLVIFKTDHTEIASQLLEGRFPDFRAIIPNGYSTSTVIETADLLRAAKRAEIFARDNANSARITVRPPSSPGDAGEMLVIGKSAERGDNEGMLQATIEGEELEISFNIKYLIDVLNVISEDRVIIESMGAASPGVIRPEGRDDFTHVIMPMSTNR